MPNGRKPLAGADDGIAIPSQGNGQEASNNECKDQSASTDDNQQSRHGTPGSAGEDADGLLTVNGAVPATTSNDADDSDAKVAGADSEQTEESAEGYSGQAAKELPMSRLDNPDDMCSDMDEDEFIRELDKFVDIIRYEDPDTVAANGLLILNENGEPNFTSPDGSMSIAHGEIDASDMAYHDIPHQLAADAIGLYGGHEYVAIHSINDSDRLSALAHEDVVMTSADLHQDTLAMVPPSLSAGSNDDGAHLPDAVDARMFISPHPHNGVVGNDNTDIAADGGNGRASRDDETHEIVNGGMSMDTSSTPPPQMST
ncbi:hypothetical protein GGI23_004427 [Coemansia sp. RSA 2559]|nr:hypothetical protein GGI23_004427 [Coemansia sp. RSA 2559]